MIHFDVINDDGDRLLYIEGTRTYVGEIAQGRKKTNLTKNWTEWGFLPADSATPASPVRDNIAEAYADARAYAAGVIR